MRVTLLSKALVVGAYQRKCELLAAQPGIELTVLVPPSWAGQKLEHAHENGYVLRELPIRLNGNFHLHYYPALPQALREAQPEIFHIDEEPYNLATYLALRAARGLKQKRRTRTIFFSWQNIAKTYPQPFRWIERKVLDGVDAGIAGNAEAAAVWRGKGFTKPLYTVPQFGVDEGAFKPQRERPKRPFTVGFAGRLVREKGADLLVRALAALPEARLVIAGDGAAKLELMELAQQLGVGTRVTFLSSLPSTEMPAFYQGLDALAVPSRTLPNWKEQFGRVLIEAMACGVPVLGSNSGEIPNVIGDAGMIFPEGDAAALTAQLLQIQNDPATRHRLRSAGRARVMARYTMRRVAEDTVTCWRECMSRQNR